MFQNPFSFDGRIRRSEYGLSYLVFIILYLVGFFLWQEFQAAPVFFFSLNAVLIWFLLAQGAKRCHDLGNSSFFQFIPFYGVFMIFQDGQNGMNKYGRNPKELAVTKIDSENNTQQFAKGKHSPVHSLLRLSSPILINVMLAAILLEFLNASSTELFLYLSISVVPCYFMALIMNHNSLGMEIGRKERFRERALYCSIFYVLVRLYTLYFRNTEFNGQTIFFELIPIGLFLCLTYFSFQLYRVIYRKTYHTP